MMLQNDISSCLGCRVLVVMAVMLVAGPGGSALQKKPKAYRMPWFLEHDFAPNNDASLDASDYIDYSDEIDLGSQDMPLPAPKDKAEPVEVEVEAEAATPAWPDEALPRTLTTEAPLGWSWKDLSTSLRRCEATRGAESAFMRLMESVLDKSDDMRDPLEEHRQREAQIHVRSHA